MRLHHRITAAVATAALAVGAGLAAAAPATAEASAPSATLTPAATATFTSVKISKLKSKITAPSSGTKEYKFRVTIAGTASDGSSSDVNGDGLAIKYAAHDADFYGPKVVALKSKVKSPGGLTLTQPTTVATGANTFTLKVPYYTSPGLYEVRIPVTQFDYTVYPTVKTTKLAKVRVDINANKKATIAATSYYAPSWKSGGTAKFTINAPAYEKGAKVTLYYKTAKAKKYKKIATKTFKVKSGSSRAEAKINTKKLSAGHKFYFKVSKVKWSSSYKTKVDKIVRR